MNTGLEGKYVVKNNQKLALGYTTGSCAAAAAKAAAQMLFSGGPVKSVDLATPKGILLHLEVLQPEISGTSASCAIRKYSGDDPDVTDGILVFAKVTSGESVGERSIRIDGGTGVGRVTKPGLEQDIGEAAINRVPRQMITEEVAKMMEEYSISGEVFVEISVPEGEALAKRTFNPRLGIVGGISILGTSGIVEPMSEEALIASIRLEMQMRRKNGAEYLVISPGNYGTDYLKAHFPVDTGETVKCSNFLGEAIDLAVELEYHGILFVSHIGKFIKAAGGIMNTHSRCADARMELLAANALRAGAPMEALKEVLESVTTDEGLSVLKRYGYLEKTMSCVMGKIDFYLNNRAFHRLEIGVLVFSNEHGELGRSGDVEGLLKKTKAWMEERV
ncbi:MAG: cobalt-precorrin-5B (C(1))-methyltransferase CbiD [Lachnospiraceae bacterium]